MSDSPTATICEHMALYARGCISEAPETEQCEIAACEMMDLLASVFADSCMEQETEDLLWHVVNVFHRRAQALEHLLDASMLQQKALIKQQDGSEIHSVELEAAMEEARSIEARLQVMEAMREAGAERFSVLTGSAWLPKSGSRGAGKAVTASVIDSREMINARNLQKTVRLIPAGKRIALAPGRSSDHARIWAVLDKVLDAVKARDESMVLLHGGSDGVEKIAALWAKNRNVPQVVFRPDWDRHGKAAPFKRNDALLEEMPAGLVVIGNDESHGIQQQLLRNARKLSVKIYRR
jgi:hypothetical protein